MRYAAPELAGEQMPFGRNALGCAYTIFGRNRVQIVLWIGIAMLPRSDLIRARSI